ncbi:MAG: LytTR family DNA-binding domain-containing protein [Pseudomonadota bacterium]
MLDRVPEEWGCPARYDAKVLYVNIPKPEETGVFPERSPSAVRVTRAVNSWSGKSRELVLKGLFVCILGVALGTAGPYGTYGNVPVLTRLGFWVCILLIPWALWEGLTALAKQMLPQDLGARKIMALLMPAFAIVGSLFATGLSALVFGLNNASFPQAWASSLASWLLFSFLIVLPLAIIADTLSQEEQRKGGENLLGFFSSKLPEKLRGSALIALQSEGHYLRVFTHAGDDLILMSMEDAMSALSAYPGIRTHRSWWIAMDQVAMDPNLAGSFTSIAAISGLNVPVSRRRRKVVRDQIHQFRD